MKTIWEASISPEICCSIDSKSYGSDSLNLSKAWREDQRYAQCLYLFHSEGMSNSKLHEASCAPGLPKLENYNLDCPVNRALNRLLIKRTHGTVASGQSDPVGLIVTK